MPFPDRRTLNVLTTALLFGLVLAIVYVARAVIVIFAFSILFAYLINPLVRFLQRHSLFFKNLRGPHVAEAYLALLILLGLMIHNFAPQFVPGVAQFVRNSPAAVSDKFISRRVDLFFVAYQFPSPSVGSGYIIFVVPAAKVKTAIVAVVTKLNSGTAVVIDSSLVSTRH
jgi:predicted PurR-regulated permease PerM